MGKKDRNASMATKNGEAPGTEPEADDDIEDQPQTGVEPDSDTDDEFEFDSALIPEGVTLEDLAPDFVRPEGFLMVPRANIKTGEIRPQNTTFVGVLHDVVPWTDNRGKQRVWFACTATADIPGTQYTGKDEKNVQFTKPVKKGDRIGISGSGAINALKTKKGHLVMLHWTGNKVQVKNGAMWEIKAKVSKEPMPAPF